MTVHTSAVLFALVILLATTNAQDYSEVNNSTMTPQLCLLGSACALPQCASCVDVPDVSFNISFVRMGRLVTTQIPKFALLFPFNATVDSIRFVNVIPEGYEPSGDSVAQSVLIGCDEGTSYRAAGSVTAIRLNRTLEIARSEFAYSIRMWPVSGVSCGTLSSVVMSWFV